MGLEHWIRITRHSLALTILLPLLPAVAQVEPAAGLEQSEVPRYTVEVVIFRYAQEVSSGSEVFLPDAPVLPDRDANEMPGELPPPEPRQEPRTLPDTEFTRLTPGEFSMTDVLGRLDRLDAYEPIMHFGWTQATWPQEQTEAIDLYRFGTPPEGLSGSLTLYRSRYLHLVVDLQMDAPGQAAVAPTDVQTYGDYRGRDDRAGDFDRAVSAGPVRYRIQENRILKNGETRYFDHPKFGVLAKVTRVEDGADALPGESELLGYPAE